MLRPRSSANKQRAPAASDACPRWMACGIPISVAPAPDPTAAFIWDPHDPSQFDTLTFLDVSVDSGGNAFNTATWDFGDGTVLTDPGPRPTHRYGADGDYTVKLSVGTTDGRTAFVTRTVQVRTHDVTINKLTVPTSAKSGQSRDISVGIKNRRYPETVRVELFK